MLVGSHAKKQDDEDWIDFERGGVGVDEVDGCGDWGWGGYC